MENTSRDTGLGPENNTGFLTGLATKTVTPLSSPHFKLYIATGALIALVLRYVVIIVTFSKTRSEKPKNKLPPVVPHFLPKIGTLPMTFLWNPLRFAQTHPLLWARQPIRAKILFREIFIVQGAEDLLRFLKQRSFSSFFLHRVFLENVWLLPKLAAETYRKDNSGEHSKPHPGSTVEHRNRVEFHVRLSQQKLLLGQGQAPFVRRFDASAANRLHSLEIGPEWTYLTDLQEIFKTDLTAAVVDALTGPALQLRHPNFVKDMWAMDHRIMSFTFNLPKFLNWTAWKARERALGAIKDWHNWARENFTPDTIDSEGNDPFFGSAFFRERCETFSNMDGFNSDAIASEELSFIWSANTNAIIASLWVTLEAFRDPDLLQAIRKEVQPCIKENSSTQISFDVPQLLRSSLLQAVFAETARLRVHGFITRLPQVSDIQINDWTLKRNHLCIACSTPATMDPEFWCRGENAAHPVHQFWPGRFLKRNSENEVLQFSLAGTEGYWVPFGGGPHACPGRVFAKRQALLTLAIMTTLYDCNILASEKDLAMDASSYPFGTIPPAGKIAARIRRRTLVRRDECIE